jgi:hypothetical protein
MSRSAGVAVDAPAQALWLRLDQNTPQPCAALELSYGPPSAAEIIAAADPGGVGGPMAAHGAAAVLPAGMPGAPAAPGGGSRPGGGPVLRVWTTTHELNQGCGGRAGGQAGGGFGPGWVQAEGRAGWLGGGEGCFPHGARPAPLSLPCPAVCGCLRFRVCLP